MNFLDSKESNVQKKFIIKKHYFIFNKKLTILTKLNAGGSYNKCLKSPERIHFIE